MNKARPAGFSSGVSSASWSPSQRAAWLGAAAVLMAACVPGRLWPGLMWVAVAPLFVGLRGLGPLSAGGWAGAYGWWTWCGSTWWLHAPLREILELSAGTAIALTLAGGLLLALPYALAGAVAAWWPRRSGWVGATREAAIFTLALYWLAPIFDGNYAHTQYRFPAVFQVVELGGTPLLLFLILWVNRLLAEGFLAWRQTRARPWSPVVAAAVILAAVLAYGTMRLRQFDAAMAAAPPDQWFTVGAIQPNLPLPLPPKRAPAPAALTNDFFTALAQGRELARQHPEVEALAFPENPSTFVFNTDTARRQALGQLILQTGKPVLLNVDAVDPAPAVASVSARYNVAAWLDADRNLAGSYAKIKRLPLVEYLPGEAAFPWLRRWFPRSLRVRAGEGPAVFELRPGIRVIPLICYEGTLSAFPRRFVRLGGNFIINQVNDSWFLRTPASEVHLAVTRYRTVEYRVPLVRVTNSGIGAHIQADGRIVPGSRTPLFAAAATAFPLYVPPQRSVYTWLGDFWMLGFLPLFLPRFPRRRGKSSIASSDS